MLSLKEQQIFDMKDKVTKFLKSHNYRVNVPVKVSETLKLDLDGKIIQGVWDPNENAIIIKRSVLQSESSFLGVLTHEFAHFHSGYGDLTREFENILTDLIGCSLLDNLKTSDKNKTSFLNRIFKR